MAVRRRAPRTRKIAFNHVMVYVKDVGAALEFYARHLGFRVIESAPGYARIRATLGTSTIALHQLERRQNAEPGNIRLYFEVSDLDALYEDLTAKDVEFKGAPEVMPWGWTHAYLTDPDGHEISLYSAGRARLARTRSKK